MHVDRPSQSRRRWAVAAVAAAAATATAIAGGAITGCGRAPSPTTTAPATTAQQSTAAAPVGLKAVYMSQYRARVLVDGGGYSLYVFGPDHRRAVTCTGTCALSWPPLTVAAGTKPTSGPGVEAGLVSAISGSGGDDVVTYSGWPLYTYVADVSPGMASGEGINLNGGPWYLMRADGDPLVPVGQPQLLGAPRSTG